MFPGPVCDKDLTFNEKSEKWAKFQLFSASLSLSLSVQYWKAFVHTLCLSQEEKSEKRDPLRNLKNE